MSSISTVPHISILVGALQSVYLFWYFFSDNYCSDVIFDKYTFTFNPSSAKINVMTLYPANWGRASKSTFYCSHSLAHSVTLTHIHKGNPDTAPLDIAPLSFAARDRKQKLPSLKYFDLPPQIAANKDWHYIGVRLYWYLQPGYLYVKNFFRTIGSRYSDAGSQTVLRLSYKSQRKRRNIQ